MGVKSFIKKSVAFVSALAMACSMVVMPAGASYAAEADSGLNLNKSVELQSDGTYKITLSSYATGEYTTVTEKSGVPLDIVLVLDQSGSMDDKVNGVKKIDSLKNAVNSFVTNISKNAKEYNVDHRIALVGYASRYDSSSKWANTGLFINGSLYNYQKAGSSTKTSRLTAQNYEDALVSVNTDGNITSSITTAISNIDANGATYTNYGLEMANGVFKNNPIKSGSNRKRIVVVFTDGQPGQSSYQESVAGSAVNEAYKTKNTYGATVYSVGFYNSASTDVTNFMNYISSNYPGAEYKDVEKQGWFGSTYTETEFVPGDKTDTKYYMKATNQTELSKIFENISHDIETPSTSVKLDKNAVTRDIITDKLDISDKAQVTAYTEDYKGSDKWQKSANQVALTTSINKDTKTVDVTGFDYAANFVDKTKAKGKRLVVEITGLTATQAGDSMITNVTNKSGVYANKDTENPSEIFNECSISIPSKSYVLDYGKTVSTNAVNDHNLKAVTKLNTAKPAPSDIPDATTMQGNYGTFDISSLKTDGGLKYTPGKINWDGFDTAYVFGQVNKSDTTEYLWGAVNFIPASSVYYEDDFVGTIKDDTNASIVWTGDWTTHGTSDTDEQSSANIQYGWEDNYDGETGYSNGSTHAAYTKGATATFTFTGTGVDIYSRTDGNVGKVYAKLSGSSKNNPDVTINKGLNIDNTSDSGTYYQIPTLSFDNLEYGTYTVKLTVLGTSDSTKKEDGKATYYLDGIRVYNPLGAVTDKNTTVGKAYDDAGELNAKYIKVRDILLDAKTFTSVTSDVSGTVFIDRVENENGVVTNNIGTFEDLGPKNEVYLKKDQGIAFNIENYDSNANVFIGLKAMSGKATNAQVTNGSNKSNIPIKSAADLYYVITPDADGNVVIKNTGDNLLSITKVRITAKSSKETSTTNLSEYSLRATPALMSYAQDFDSLQVVENDKEDTTDEDTTLDEDDVTIENPSEDEDNKDESSIGGFWNTIINSINKWFGIK